MLRSLVDRYQTALDSIPPPGGNGCHPALLGVANLGLYAGRCPEEVYSDISRNIPIGTRQVSDREIWDAVNRASADLRPRPSQAVPKAKPAVRAGEAVRNRIIDDGVIDDEADLWEASPIKVDWEPSDDPVRFLAGLYEPDDLVFIGQAKEPGVMGQNIKSVAEWGPHFGNGGNTAPHITVNPLTGLPAPKKSGDGFTYRGDKCVAAYRYAMAEFDDIPYKSQIQFWCAAKLPIRALIDTGGKSIHVWIELCGISSERQWEAKIRRHLYQRLLVPIGVDSACSNPSRLSRLPGYERKPGRYQRILWLSPKGRPINA